MREELDQIIEGLQFLVPELFLFSGFILLIIAGFFFNKSRYVIPVLAALLFLICLISVCTGIPVLQEGSYYGGMLYISGTGQYLKVLMLTGAVFTIFLSESFFTTFKRKGEYYAIIAALTLSGHLLVMGTNLLLVFIALELIALCSYILVALVEDTHHIESAVKYIYFGLFTAALTLFGFTFLYGFSGTLNFQDAAFAEGLSAVPPPMLMVAMFLSLCGILFKISAFPFHIWTPDVYQGTSLPVVAFLSVVPKIAAFGFLLFFFNAIENIEVLGYNIVHLLALISIITLTIGNFGALRQNNVKRLMAYSAIAQGGFVLVGFCSGNLPGNTAVLFYLTVYLLMNLGTFVLIHITHCALDTVDIDQYSGAGRQMPYTGLLFLIVMIALTGIPPTLGFSGKLLLFSGLLDAYAHGGERILLVLFIFGLLNTAVALFFYLKIPYFMFFKESNLPVKKQNGYLAHVIASVLILPLFLLFFKTNWLVTLIQYFNH